MYTQTLGSCLFPVSSAALTFSEWTPTPQSGPPLWAALWLLTAGWGPLRLRQEHLAPDLIANWAFFVLTLVENCLILEGVFKFRGGLNWFCCCPDASALPLTKAATSKRVVGFRNRTVWCTIRPSDPRGLWESLPLSRCVSESDGVGGRSL